MMGFKTKTIKVRVYTSEVEGSHTVIEIYRTKGENTKEEIWDEERAQKRVAWLKAKYLKRA